MNILIVGNGFDLSHYLPTKYDHFMDVMAAIEKKDLGKPFQNVFSNPVNTLPDLFFKGLEIKRAVDEKAYKMNFNSLFFECRDKKFIDKTKEIYDVSSIELSIEKIVKFQDELKNNCWYQYFKNHVEEIKTWIDFEQKIEEALRVVAKFIVSLDRKLDEFGSFSHEINFYGEGEPRQIFLTREQCNLLEKLNILNSGFFIDQDDYDEMGYNISVPIDIGDPDHGSLRFYISDQYIQKYSGYVKVNNGHLLNSLQEILDEFIIIFNLYLELIVSQLSPANTFSIESEDWIYPDKIFSFNYTNTYQRIHDSVDVEYLHGSHGEDQNIVLGVSDLESESLNKIKTYGFTKYQQKLFKDTDYLFLDGYKNNISKNEEDILALKNELKGENRAAYRDSLNNKIRSKQNECKLNLNITIWGHSLDVSDKDYILDLFSLNDVIDRNGFVAQTYL